jgi:peptide/nickel transport system substrate-binding protein
MPITLRSKRNAALLSIAVASSLALAACSSSGSTTAATSSSTGGTYQLGLAAPAGNIDPLTTSDYNAMFLVGLAGAGLIIENNSGTLEPQLATSWKPSDDGLSWTVDLRKGAEFSNGDAVTPKDVVATFESIIGPKSQSPAASSFSGILTSVAAGSGDSVVFTLGQKYEDFPYLLTGANTTILPAGTDDAKWVDDPVGAGQFVLKKYTAGQGVTFVKNEHYWDAKNVKLDGVDVKFYSDTQSQLLAFQSGEVDQISQSPAVTSALTEGTYTAFTQGYEKFDGLTFNTTKAPFDDVKVRQAVAWALDRKALVKTSYGDDATIGNDFATFPDYAVQPKGLTRREQDASKVKSLLGGKTVSFAITTYTAEQPLAEQIQQQLNAIDGFKVTLNVQPESQYYGGSNSTTPWLNADVTLTDWADRLPSQLVSLAYQSGGVWNAAHYSNKTLDSLANEFEATTDESKRQDIANRIATIQWTDVPIVIAAFQKNGIYLSKKVQGTFPNGQNFNGGFDFRGISVTN